MTSEDTTTTDESTTGDATVSPVTRIGEETSDDDTFNRQKAREGARLLLEAIGEDPDRPALRDTWERRVPDVFETFSEGRRADEKPTLRTFDTDANDIVVKTGIPLYSLCEHHLLPYHGQVHVAYRPDDCVVGLSKLPRYVRWQARRPTMQEELTREIAEGLATELNAEAVLVEASATHMCEAMRGVETATQTTTSASVGSPTEAERRRFRDAIGRTEGSR